ncbi:hypothetical protein An14g06030 [Aspergillus niger]|uniref:Uncharacterized protein n=2 Tax=Aspergillus niger TaxID=5061 RepID=A2R3Z6_ASPNC|nr:hypothetical protein An14g06030 [Aspergillus niger]CAK42164.1 hypothetical protein An14g06030 [Aspergillus niger]
MPFAQNGDAVTKADYQVEEGIKYLREVKTTLHPFVVKAPSVGSYT